MRSIVVLVILTITMLGPFVQPKTEDTEVNYTLFDSFEIIRPPTSSFFVGTPSSFSVLFYSSPSTEPLTYDLFTWKKLATKKYHFPQAKSLTFFRDGANKSCALYMTTTQIKVRKYEQESYSDELIYNNYTCGNDTGILAVSEDGLLWAVGCYMSVNPLLIGNFSQPIDSAQPIPIAKPMQEVQLLWRPNSHQLIATGYKANPFQSYLLTIDAVTLTVNITTLRLYIQDIVFAPSGLLFFFDSSYIRSFNFSSGELTGQQFGEYIRGIQKRGNFLVIQAQNYEQGDQLEEYYFLFTGGFNKNSHFFKLKVDDFIGRSLHDGTFLYALTKNNQSHSNLTIYKLCNIQGQFYEQSHNQCQACLQPCLNCLYSQQLCASCVNLTFYYVQSQYSCESCSTVLDWCLTCQNQSWCLSCQTQYVAYQGSCWVCGYFIDGCRQCSSATSCIRCDSTHYLEYQRCQFCFNSIEKCMLCSNKHNCTKCQPSYTVYIDHTCKKCQTLMEGCILCQALDNCTSCMDSYTLNSNSSCSICSQVMEGCLNCTNTDQCVQCNARYFINQYGKCTKCEQAMQGCRFCSVQNQCQECQVGYTINEEMTCSRCSQLIDNCIECSSSQKCSQCSAGYALNEQSSRCLEIGNQAWLIILIAITLVLVIAFVIYKMIQKKKANKTTNRQLLANQTLLEGQSESIQP